MCSRVTSGKDGIEEKRKKEGRDERKSDERKEGTKDPATRARR